MNLLPPGVPTGLELTGGGAVAAESKECSMLHQSIKFLKQWNFPLTITVVYAWSSYILIILLSVLSLAYFYPVLPCKGYCVTTNAPP